MDSGVFLRVDDEGKSYQVTLDNRPDGMIGALYMVYIDGYAHKNDSRDIFQKAKWNSMKIRIEGQPPNINAWMNGGEIIDFQFTEKSSKGVPKAGFIGLQIHPGGSYESGKKVRLRNIRIKKL